MKWCVRYYVEDVIVEAETRDQAIKEAAGYDSIIELLDCEPEEEEIINPPF